MKKLTIYLVLLLMVVGACKKYDEGPLISLRTKEARLCREWKLDKYIVNDETFDEVGKLVWKIEKNGIIHLNIMVGSNEETSESEWRWADNKESLEIKSFGKKSGVISSLLNYKGSNYEAWSKFRIMRLTSKELSLEINEDNDDIRIEFVEK